MIPILSLLVAGGQLLVQWASRDDVFSANIHGRAIATCTSLVDATDGVRGTVYEAAVFAQSAQREPFERGTDELRAMIEPLRRQAIALEIIDQRTATEVGERFERAQAGDEVSDPRLHMTAEKVAAVARDAEGLGGTLEWMLADTIARLNVAYEDSEAAVALKGDDEQWQELTRNAEVLTTTATEQADLLRTAVLEGWCEGISR